jgi:hypothetical protein
MPETAALCFLIGDGFFSLIFTPNLFAYHPV